MKPYQVVGKCTGDLWTKLSFSITKVIKKWHGKHLLTEFVQKNSETEKFISRQSCIQLVRYRGHKCIQFAWRHRNHPTHSMRVQSRMEARRGIDEKARPLWDDAFH